MPAPVTGLFIIRAWIEQGSTEPLRAHIRLTTDISCGFEDSMTLSEVRAVCEAVATWLGNIITPPSRDCDAGPITMTEPDSADDQEEISIGGWG